MSHMCKPKTEVKFSTISPEVREDRLRQARAFAVANTEMLRAAFESDSQYFRVLAEKHGCDVLTANSGVWVGPVVCS
jgi:hypothetical protein